VLQNREHNFSQLYKEFKRRPDVLDLILKLTYAMEYCRSARKRYLYLSDSSGVAQSVQLELEKFANTPKYCYSEGCTKFGTLISCSKCLICCWCSEQCLSKSYDGHLETVCIAAEKHR
jgi:hypothetical protein